MRWGEHDSERIRAQEHADRYGLDNPYDDSHPDRVDERLAEQDRAREKQDAVREGRRVTAMLYPRRPDSQVTNLGRRAA